jgi:RecB family endonuclease NucS
VTIDEFLNSKAFSRGDPTSYEFFYKERGHTRSFLSKDIKTIKRNYEIITQERPMTYTFIKVVSLFPDGNETFEIPKEWNK